MLDNPLNFREFRADVSGSGSLRRAQVSERRQRLPKRASSRSVPDRRPSHVSTEHWTREMMSTLLAPNSHRPVWMPRPIITKSAEYWRAALHKSSTTSPVVTFSANGTSLGSALSNNLRRAVRRCSALRSASTRHTALFKDRLLATQTERLVFRITSMVVDPKTAAV